MNTQEIFSLMNDIFKTKEIQESSFIIDYSFFGSSSGYYGWKETKFCDFDIWIYVNKIELIDYVMMQNIIELINEKVTQKFNNIDVIIGAVNGPYKPSVWEIREKEVLFVHILLDDYNSYKKRTIFTQLSWSKYEAYFNKKLLKTLLIKKPEYIDLLNSECGILNAINIIEDKVVLQYLVYNIDKGTKSILRFDNYSTQYIEFLAHSVMMISRNKARLDGYNEPNFLNNKDFSIWHWKEYDDSVVIEINRIKNRISEVGYRYVNKAEIENLVYEWLIKKKHELEDLIT